MVRRVSQKRFVVRRHTKSFVRLVVRIEEDIEKGNESAHVNETNVPDRNRLVAYSGIRLPERIAKVRMLTSKFSSINFVKGE